MKFKKCSFVSLLFIVTAIYNQTVYASRIDAPTDPGARCLKKGIAAELCESNRKKALNHGCIDQQEYNDLVKFGSSPICDYSTTGKESLQAWCSCGCVHPNTAMAVEIKTDEDFITQVLAVNVAYNRSKYQLITLGENAEIEKNFMDLDKKEIVFTTVGHEERAMIQLRMVDGRSLRLTENHPVVLSNGELKQAESLRPNDQLVDISGQHVSIKSLQSYPFNGQVVNFATTADLSNEGAHVVFGNDFAIGDLALQALMDFNIKSIELRR